MDLLNESVHSADMGVAFTLSYSCLGEALGGEGDRPKAHVT